MTLALMTLMAFSPAPGQQVERGSRREVESVDEPREEAVVIDFEVSARHYGFPGSVAAGLELEVGALPVGDTEPRSLNLVPLARGTTDADGVLPVGLSLRPALARDPALVIWVRPATRGYQRRPSFRKPAWIRTQHGFPVTVARGGTLRGVVRDDSGLPAPGAVLWLVGQGAGRVSTTSTAWADGRFELDFHEPGPAIVLARASGVGAGRSVAVDLPADRPPDDVEVVVGGAGVVAGRLVDPAGQPLRRVVVRVGPAELDHVPADHEIVVREEGGGGLVSDVGETDGDGRFRFSGLAPGRYGLFAGDREPAAVGWIDTGEEDPTIVVGRHRLVVRVLDHVGRPVALAAPPRRTFGRRVGVGPRIVCLLLDLVDHPSWHSQSELEIAVLDDALAVAVEPDRTYLVGYLSPSTPPCVREVYVPPDRHRIELRLVLPPPVIPGRLVASVRTPVPPPPYSLWRIEVFTLETGLLVASVDEGRMSEELPPGLYRVRAEDRLGPGCGSGPPLVPDFAPVEETLEILSGQELVTELVLEGSGRIAVTIEIPGSGPVEPWENAWSEAHDRIEGDAGVPPWEMLAAIQEETRRVVGGCRIRLVSRTDGRVLRPELYAYRGGCTMPWAAVGDRCTTTTPIPPGAYELVAELPDGRELRADVVVRHGETVDVELRAD